MGRLDRPKLDKLSCSQPQREAGRRPDLACQAPTMNAARLSTLVPVEMLADSRMKTPPCTASEMATAMPTLCGSAVAVSAADCSVSLELRLDRL